MEQVFKKVKPYNKLCKAILFWNAAGWVMGAVGITADALNVFR